MKKIYRHYKSNKLYVVLDENMVDPITNELMVQYTGHNTMDKEIYTRPKNEFFEQISDSLLRFNFVFEVND